MPQHREPTLTDVAERAGVSLTTVSRVLNNRGYLSQATRSRVAEAIKELGYRPNQVARALHGKSTQSVGIIVPTVSLPFFGELSAEIEDALASHGYRTLICNSLGRRERERDYLDLLVSHRVDGIISGAHNEDLSEYRTIHMPLVTVDRDLSPAVPNVRCANEDGARAATEHLLARGARRPALLTSRSGAHNRREAGYRAVLEEAGIEPVVLTVDFHTPDGRRAQMVGEGLDAVRDRVDAVFATDDLSAADAVEWARARGLDVPGEFKVVGFDGTTALRRALPGLTTVQQPIRAIARTAVELLLEQITALRDDGEVPRPARPVIELPGTLVQGRTT
ncbi:MULTISPECIES: LacI family DNA-binding transcriptional regulator [unclassified Actinomyces]|uniref:LacI family DNA-binding transcriptional regulator n=1 Tax=unclassified Actinomyces TaxID=2609248 RepID=UPI002017288D|nr:MULTISPECIES: LacI family DNA-binding transcriptional regulator [unclassified Actinomyces]MCL3778197.1 LacI family DNA-binding transcriptional regulator [Actinomyces sp. AC-20-1]MCL3788900.1 LacI family DNA-binding transcriptional regulator [Actinomyces sp. 187325]MCL3792200.1 LacI family DNA-binding transcriptional regulator [Actinomyces sp. 186855]MCL3794173.1 LacI family DNA-binding transcriptional regulator [Actinomyces sp. 217892]